MLRHWTRCPNVKVARISIVAIFAGEQRFINVNDITLFNTSEVDGIPANNVIDTCTYALGKAFTRVTNSTVQDGRCA